MGVDVHGDLGILFTPKVAKLVGMRPWIAEDGHELWNCEVEEEEDDVHVVRLTGHLFGVVRLFESDAENAMCYWLGLDGGFHMFNRHEHGTVFKVDQLATFIVATAPLTSLAVDRPGEVMLTTRGRFC